MSFFDGKDIEKISTDVNKAAQKIKANADWMKKSFESVNQWFENFEIISQFDLSIFINELFY